MVQAGVICIEQVVRFESMTELVHLTTCALPFWHEGQFEDSDPQRMFFWKSRDIEEARNVRQRPMNRGKFSIGAF